MAITKEKKQKILEDLREMFSRQKAIILIGITGLKVKDISKLRKKIKLIDGNLKVAKKTLMGLVFKENNLEFDKNKFKEEVALVFGFKGDELRSSSPSLHSPCSFRSGDEVLIAKTVYQSFKENKKIKILGGYFENSFKEAEEVITLAQLPSKNELMARLVGGLKAPISNFVNVLEGNIKGLLCVLSRIKT